MKRPRAGVYMIHAAFTDWDYVGSSKNPMSRVRSHQRDLERNRHSNLAMQEAWNRTGGRSWMFSLLEWVDNEADLLAREQHWIDETLKSGRALFNVIPVADRSKPHSYCISEEAKDRRRRELLDKEVLQDCAFVVVRERWDNAGKSIYQTGRDFRNRFDKYFQAEMNDELERITALHRLNGMLKSG